MPRDIRSYLKPPPKPKEKIPLVNLSDDEIPESPDVQIKTKKREPRKKRVLSDSSDEDIFTVKKKKTDKPTNKTDINNKSEKNNDKLKEVKASDLFGAAPIKRTEPIVKKDKKKLKTETGIHSDEEFEKSLVELDADPKLNGDDKLTGEENAKSKFNSSNKSQDNVETKSEFFNETNSTRTPDPPELVVTKVKETKLSSFKIPKKQTTDRDVKIENQITRSKSRTPEKPKSRTPEKYQKRTPEKPKFSTSEKSKSSSKPEISKSESQIKSSCRTPNKDKSSLNDAVVEDKPKSNLEKKLSMNKDGDRKRDFSEFISNTQDEGSSRTEEDHTPQESKSKKKKLDKSLNSSGLSDEERHERRMHTSILYKQYLNRSGPKHLGSKQIPEGTADCLKECSFVVTGVLDSFEREEVCEAIARFGGSVKGQPSKKVTHILAGEDAGPAKLAKAEELGIKIINEDQFLQMIVDLSTKQTNDLKPEKDIKGENNKSKSKESVKAKEDTGKTKSANKKSKEKNIVAPDQMKTLEEKIKSNFYGKSKSKEIETKEIKTKVEESGREVVELKESEKKEEASSSASCSSTGSKVIPDVHSSQMMWVDKYRPQTLKQIIGQHGDNSNVKKLMNWLSKWYVNRKKNLPKPSPWSKNDDGGYYKAALLSGPPGVGKTTSVSLVCSELGFDVVELNASDARSKTLVRDQVGELLTSHSLRGYSRGETGKQAVTKKHVLVMDEVDGMAGNEDRGGLQELISLIKSTSVPIICMCNDRSSDKMRTLVNYCYDLKYSRPRVDQIKSAMLSICFKEGLKIPAEALTQLIVASNQDVRQTLNSLSLWAANPGINDVDSLKTSAHNSKKDMKMGPWEAVRRVFSAEDHKSMSLHDKSDLFFCDYNIMPLFVQENYLAVVPHCPKNEVLSRLSDAADSISAGDLVENRVRRQQAWNLLPTQAMLSVVIPGAAMSGHVGGQIQFPGWLGRNSRQNKMHRLAQTIHAHTRLSATGSKSSIFLDYCVHLRDAVVTPLVQHRLEGVERSVEVLSAYHLLREDLDSLLELSQWPGQRDPMILVDSKVKAAMTRAYNKQAPALPYSLSGVSKGRGVTNGDDLDDEEDDLGGPSDDERPENDKLIKVNKKKAAIQKEDKPSSSKGKNEDKPSTSKGKKGKGKK